MKKINDTIGTCVKITLANTILTILTLSFIISCVSSAYSQESPSLAVLEYQIQTAQSIQQLPALSWMIQEEKQQLTIQDILSGDYKDAKVVKDLTAEQLIGPFGKYWFAISISPELPLEDWLLFLKEKWHRANYIKGYPDISVYFTKGGELLYMGKTGSEIPASERDVVTHNIMSLIDLNCQADEDLLLWVSLHNNELRRPIPELYLYDSTINLPTFEKEEYITFGLSIGVTLLLLIISSFLWFWTKESIYGWFIIILGLMGITELLTCNEEWLVTWLFPEHGYLRFRVAMFLSLTLRVFLLYFGRVFINLSKYYPKLDLLFKKLIWFTIFGLGSIGLFFPRGAELSLNVWLIWTVLLVLYSLMICIICLRLIFTPNTLAQIYGLGVGLFFSTPVLGPLFQNLGISQVFFNPESLAPIGMTLTMLFGLIYRFWEVEYQKSKQLQQINIVSNKFVPKTFLNFLGKKNILDATLGDYVEKQVTVMFSDIRDYTSLSEKMTPKQNFKFVNAFNQRIGPIIHKNKGFINQYLGDGVMAIFPESVEDTLKAAIDMQQNVTDYNAYRKEKGRIPLRMGIGLHAGLLIMGIIGYDERLDAAIISDTVNTASRLEELTKYFGVSIIVSDTVINNLPNKEQYGLRYLGLVQVKGKQEAVKIYDCFDGDIEEIRRKKQITNDAFNKGVVAYFSKAFETADKCFRKVLEQHPDDYTAQLFYKKTKAILSNGIPDDWTGIEVTYSS